MKITLGSIQKRHLEILVQEHLGRVYEMDPQDLGITLLDVNVRITLPGAPADAENGPHANEIPETWEETVDLE